MMLYKLETILFSLCLSTLNHHYHDSSKRNNVDAYVYYQNQREHYPPYEKPKPSNGPCIDSIERMEAVILDTSLPEEGMKFCLGCYETTQSSCPSLTSISLSSSNKVHCQSLIDDIYKKCDQVLLPKRFFYDPPVSDSLR